jgi:hypothetical protein
MNKKNCLLVLVFTLILIIPSANAQLTIGEKANQKLIEVKLNDSGVITIKHLVSVSNSPVTTNLFEGKIANLKVTDESGEDIFTNGSGAGIANDEKGNLSIFIFSLGKDVTIEYNLENASTLIDNMWNVKLSYDQTYSILFQNNTDTIYLNNSLIQLGENKGITMNGGGNINLKYYSNTPKIIQEVKWEENKFDVEIITNSEIKDFNFDQAKKNISFQINEKNQFITVTMSNKLLGGPYMILLDDESIVYSKFLKNENYTSLSIKPESTGQITIIGTTVIPEFSMFIPLIMGFLIILTVPFMKKFSLH